MKSKATQPEAGKWDRSRVLERHCGEGNGLQVRHDRDSRVHHRISKGTAEDDHFEGNGGLRHSAEGDVKGVSMVTSSAAVDCNQKGMVSSPTGNKVSYYFTNILECFPIFLLRL